MGKIVYSGPLALQLRSLAKLSQIAVSTKVRHCFGHRMAEGWDANMETGIRVVRHQFTQAMRHSDIKEGRKLFDSVQPQTDDVYAIAKSDAHGIKGHWYDPEERESDAVLLYFHGGGYAFHGGVSDRFAQMLAHHTAARLLVPEYRLTPEHPHPAQAEDAMAAWDYLSAHVPAEKIVVIGDSAGGHMALMLLQALKAQGKPQPALCIGLCPWTDIGARGTSLSGNDRTDLVQGWMALQFGRWLDPDLLYGREALSPISYDYKGLAPLYLQAGGREVLRDMIIDFAQEQKEKGADVRLDLWPDMPHDFQAYDSMTASSQASLVRIRQAIDSHINTAGGHLRCLEGATIV
ncbi:alpha/beta hydrolase [Celeribacter baekdonensis]|uniref:alpha/beta hydrolase n=1 Tax=Celeribacter baekdonensis TaxID=875171 RepID=UPI0030DB0D3E|tara:strand:+ start:82375 stop:83418 length:1044 start_codon:yes stop_codon:yes gene_type:complete